MSRFSRQGLTDALQKDIDALQANWGFDIDNGTVQIEFVAADRMKTNPINHGSGPRDRAYHLREATLDYGRLQALHALAVAFELPVSYVPVSHGTKRKIGLPRPGMIRYVSDAQAQYALDQARKAREA
jgi:hypothetical protein